MVCKDGAIGPLTLMEVVETVLEEIINLLSVYEDAVYRPLSAFETFGRGWIRRNYETREQQLKNSQGRKLGPFLSQISGGLKDK